MTTRRSTDLHIRLKPAESRAWQAAAKRADMTLSEWVRQLGNAAAAPSPVAKKAK